MSNEKASDISAKEQLNTHGSGEPSAENVKVSAYDGESYDDAISTNNPQAEEKDNSRSKASDISAKEVQS